MEMFLAPPPMVYMFCAYHSRMVLRKVRFFSVGYISQLIFLFKARSISDLNNRGQVLIPKLLKQVDRFYKAFSKFNHRHSGFIDIYNIGL